MYGTASAILRQIEALGYKVSEFHVNDMVEMHAVLLANPDKQYIARVNDGHGEVETYRCACALAEIVGIELDDG